MGNKTGPKCNNCDEELQWLDHLYLKCNTIQKLLACFEKSSKLTEKISNLEKQLVVLDPSINRTKFNTEKLGILRRLIYQSNHKDEKPKWGQFLNLIERVYMYEYAIA